MAVRSALHQAGALLLNELLQHDPPEPEQRTRSCGCGHTALYRGLRSKTILTVLGAVEVVRPYFLCPHCHHGQFPADVDLDLENTELSPGVRRMLAVVGNDAPFDHGREQMKLLAGLEVTTKAVERTAEAIGADIGACQQQEMNRTLQLDLPIPIGPTIPVLYVEFDGTGVPVVRAETEGRQGKIDGQPAHTREARQHLWDLARKLHPGDDVAQKRWLLPQLDRLENGKIENLVAELRSTPAATAEIADTLRIEAEYFNKNTNRMRYPTFRRQGLFVGSGVIEAGCKTAIGRLKQSGMFWTVRGANAIIALRCNRLSGRFEDYWEARRA
jgi:hypothetical protein